MWLYTVEQTVRLVVEYVGSFVDADAAELFDCGSVDLSVFDFELVVPDAYLACLDHLNGFLFGVVFIYCFDVDVCEDGYSVVFHFFSPVLIWLIIRFDAMRAYSGLISVPTNWRPCLSATTPTVPEPVNGSRTRSLGLVDEMTQGSTSASGMTAKCAPL